MQEAEHPAGPAGAARAAEPNLRQLLTGASAVLAEAGVPSPDHDARALAAYAFGLPHLELATAPAVTAEFRAEFATLLDRRRRREPLQQIVGYTVFRYVTLRIEPGVFVPRPETEVVAGVAIDELLRRQREHAGSRSIAVDLCTGSGAIACAVDTETDAQVIAVEADPVAARLAQVNLGAVGKPGSRVEIGDVREESILADLARTVDVVVANPPYIPPHAEPTEPEVRDHDPDLALYGGGHDGLELPAAVVRAATRLLAPGGLLVMEHAEVQDAAARDLLERTEAFTDIRTVPDLTGRPRMVRGTRRAQ